MKKIVNSLLLMIFVSISITHLQARSTHKKTNRVEKLSRAQQREKKKQAQQEAHKEKQKMVALLIAQKIREHRSNKNIEESNSEPSA